MCNQRPLSLNKFVKNIKSNGSNKKIKHKYQLQLLLYFSLQKQAIVFNLGVKIKKPHHKYKNLIIQ